jgi:hypothetical protein
VLSPDEALALAQTAGELAHALPDDRSEPYRSLAAAAAAGTVLAQDVPLVERVCVLALETGKAHQLGGAAHERLLSAVYRRTPAGAAAQEETAELNRALSGLGGRVLQGAKVLSRSPGHYQLELRLDGVDVTLVFGPDGAGVHSLQPR